MWHLFRYHRWPGLRHARRRRFLVPHSARPSRGSVRRGADTAMIRVVLPTHLKTLAKVSGEVQLDLEGPVTTRTILDALEKQYPVLTATIRDHDTQKSRAFLRFFVCNEDLSHEPPDAPLPDAIASGAEPFFIIGAIAGG